MAKPQEKITKLDLRIPNELFAQIKEIAIEDGAKIHHISGEPTLSPTAIKLMEEAIKYRKLGLKQEDDEMKSEAQTLVVEALQQITAKLAELDKRPIRQIVLGGKRLQPYDPKAVSETLENMKRARQEVSPKRPRSEGFPVDSVKQY
jgi:hypothetical protein